MAFGIKNGGRLDLSSRENCSVSRETREETELVNQQLYECEQVRGHKPIYKSQIH